MFTYLILVNVLFLEKAVNTFDKPLPVSLDPLNLEKVKIKAILRRNSNLNVNYIKSSNENFDIIKQVLN